MNKEAAQRVMSPNWADRRHEAPARMTRLVRSNSAAAKPQAATNPSSGLSAIDTVDDFVAQSLMIRMFF
jgi:hypothetical protein